MACILRLPVYGLEIERTGAMDSPSGLRHDGTYEYLDDVEGELPSLLPRNDFSLFVSLEMVRSRGWCRIEGF